MTKKSPKATSAKRSRSAALKRQILADKIRALSLRVSELEEHFREIGSTPSPGNVNNSERTDN